MNKKKLFPLALVPLAATSLQAQSNIQTGRTDKRPNIILFMVDDMGWQDTSLPFWTQKTHYNELYETPNMERLARQGMMFTQAYASSISSPTRCSLITGTNAARHRVTNWTLQKNTMTDRKDKQLAVPDWNYNGVSQVPGTNNTFVGTSFVQILKDNGYHTIHCGKAHFGSIDTPGEDPHHWGFEVNIAGHAAGGLASYLGEENYGHTKDGKPVSLMAVPGLEKYWGTETFVTEALTQEAIKALNKAKKYNQPFYLYMAQYAIHGYEVNALDYVIKPIAYYPFSVKLRRAIRMIRETSGNSLLLPFDGEERRIPTKDILYVEVHSHTVDYYTYSGVSSVTGTLKMVEEKLKNDYFVRCNSCYLVNLRHVTGLKDDTVIVEGHSLKISRAKKKEFMNQLSIFYSEAL